MNANTRKTPATKLELAYAYTKRMTSRQCWFGVSVVVLVLSTITIVLTQAIEIYSNSKMKIIMDTDAGTDDAMALFYLLRAEKYAKLQNKTDGPEILGITCVHGNTEVDHVVVNVLKVLQTVNRLDIPVYKGAESSILRTPERSDFFGQDGMGDIPMANPPSIDLAQSEHAVNALIRLVDENPDEITLLATGPLTNIALAVRLDNNFLKKIKKLIILGGSVEGKGNIKPGIEFNFYMDPEANHIALNGANYKDHTLMMIPLETIMKMNISMKWRKDILGDLESAEMVFMNKIEHIENYPDGVEWEFADPVAAAIALNESLVQKIESYSVESITEGSFRGGIVVDYTNLMKNPKKIDIVFQFDSERFKSSLIKHFT